MNIEELKGFILTADRQALCDALQPLDEKLRATLFSDAVPLYRLTEKASAPGKDPKEPTGLESEDWFDADFVRQLRAASYPDWRCPRWTASLMLLGICDEKFLKNPYKFDCGWVGSDLRQMPQRVLQVLDARRPKWLPAFAKRDVKEEFPTIAWTVEYGLIRSGVLPTNDSEEFYRRMAVAPLMSEHFNSDAVKQDSLPPRPKKLVDYLRADPHLVDVEIWKLFDFDTGAFNFSHSPWFEAVVALCNDGEIDRTQLLRRTAEAMSGNARPKELAGYGKLHELLEPTVAEREAVVEHSLATLHSPHSAVVGAALSALEKLAKAKRLSPDSFLNHCEDALRLAQKSPVLKTIRMMSRLAKQDASSVATTTETLAIAVAHERSDVQEAALKELESHRASFTELTRSRLRDAEAVIASVHKTRLADLLAPAKGSNAGQKRDSKSGKHNAAKAAVTKNGDRKKSPTNEVAALRKRIQALPAEICEATGVTEALHAVESGDAPFVATINPGQVPRRDSAQAIEPIESLEELIDTVAAVIERVDDAMDIERVLDGIAMFGRERPQDFEKRVAPLRKRIEKLDDPYSRNVIDRGAQIGFSQLLAHWLEMEPIRRDFDSWSSLDGLLFRQRCGEIVEDWRMQHEPARLLAFPTHRGGWLDPEVLVARVREHYLEARRVTNDFDIASALLRLTPDGRHEALAALKKTTDDRSKHRLYGCGLELPFALGEGSEIGGKPSYSWDYRRHAAATHARLLVEGPDFEPSFRIASATMENDFTVRVDGPFCDDPSLPERLCVFAHSHYNKGLPTVREPDWVNQLETILWPANPRPMLMLGCLESVFDADFSWPPEAARSVMYATCVESKELRQLATDALIQAIDEVRVNPEMLGSHMARLGEHLVLKRTAEVLASVGTISVLHQWAVFRILDAFVTHQEAIAKDLHFALTPMLEAALSTGSTVSDKSRALLQTAKGSSKTAKLARQILALEPDPVKQLESRIQSATAAIDRAERWDALRR